MRNFSLALIAAVASAQEVTPMPEFKASAIKWFTFGPNSNMEMGMGMHHDSTEMIDTNV